MQVNGLQVQDAAPSLGTPAINLHEHKHEGTDAPQPPQFEVASLWGAPQDTVIEDTKLSKAEWAALEFMPFSKSSLWQSHSESTSNKKFSYTTAMVNSYCHLLVNYLMDGLQNGSIDKSKTQYVLELNAGNGCFSILVLQGLLKLLNEYSLNDIDLCYVLSDANKQNCERMAAHPYLQAHLKEGRARVVNFDATTHSPLSSVLGEGIDNPLMVIANGVFNTLQQELLYVHYGQVYAGEVALQGDGQSTEALDKSERNQQILANLSPMQRIQLGINNTQSGDGLIEGQESDLPSKNVHAQNILYRWEKITNIDHWLMQQPKDLQAFLKLQINQYVKLIPHHPVFLPVAALNCLNALNNNCPKGMLLLAADSGPIDLPAIKHTGLPTQIRNPDFTMPVNLHCINKWLKQGGALSTAVQQEINGTAFTVAVLDPQKNSFGMTLQATQQYLLNQNPADSLQLIESLTGAVNALSEEQILCYLRVSQFDPRVLQLFLPRLLKQGVKILARLKWCEVLSQVWRHHVPAIGNTDGSDEGAEFAFNLGQLAIDLSHWQLAKQCFASELQINKSSASLWHNLALAAFATAENDMAEKCINNAVGMSEKKPQPAHEKSEVTIENNQSFQSLELQQSINAYQAYCDAHKYFDGDGVGDVDSGLTLQPLAQHHAAEFYLQYRDADIAAMVRGYDLNTPEEVAAAIAQWQKEPEQINYALIHPDLGLVGACMLAFNDEQTEHTPMQATTYETNPDDINREGKKSAHVSFWVGSDYQGRGFGQYAVSLAVSQARAIAERQPLNEVTTSVWQHNHRSQVILLRLGFIAQNRVKSEGEQAEVFYCLPLAGRASEADEATDVQHSASEDRLTGIN